MVAQLIAAQLIAAQLIAAQLIFNGIRIFAVVFLISSCSSQGCRSEKLAEAEAAAGSLNKLKTLDPAANETVRIFKYDGTLQCGMGKAIPLEIMLKDLGSLKVFSSERKNDGLMRIQLCGTPTGSSNVYQILKTDLAKAKTFGFKEWTFE
jgi:hypothetical protein